MNIIDHLNTAQNNIEEDIGNVNKYTGGLGLLGAYQSDNDSEYDEDVEVENSEEHILEHVELPAIIEHMEKNKCAIYVQEKKIW